MNATARRPSDEEEEERRLAGRWRAAPDDPAVAFRLGNLAFGRGDAAAAVGWYREAVRLAPTVAEPYNNAAAALLALARPEAAAVVARQGLAVRPDDARLHLTLANAERALGNHEAAADGYARSLDLDPASIHAAVNLANQLRDLGRTAPAEAAYARALAERADHAAAIAGRARPRQQAERHEAAIAGFRRALALAPGDRAAANNLAISLLETGRRLDALAIYRDLAERCPDVAEAQGNLALTLQGLGRHGEAMPAFRRALAMADDPTLAAAALQSARYLCDWRLADRLAAGVLAATRAALDGDGTVAVSPFALAATPAPPDLRLAVARAWGRRLERRAIAAAGAEPPAPAMRPAGRLRVGYVSPDFRRHSVGLALRDVIAEHDRDRFHWTAYSLSREPEDELTEHFRRHVDRFVDLRPLSLADQVRRIRDDGIDVLVDLAGPTRDSGLELFALRPVAVQAHWLGWGATVGLDAIPWLVTDRVHTPDALLGHLHESAVRLPASFMAAPRPRPPAPPPGRAEAGLPPAGPVLAAFNAPYKIDAEAFALWLDVLRAVPDAVLWLKGGEPAAERALTARAETAGVAGARLVFASRVDNAAHLARLRPADLALDTLRHVGGVTTLDALAAGVPVVTVAGPTHAARTGASILGGAGLDTLVAADPAAARELAIRLLREPAALAAARAAVAAAAASPLFDPAALARHLEAAWQAIHAHTIAGRPPATIDL